MLPRVMARSYLARLLFWMLALVVTLETVSLATTRQVIRTAVTDNARAELQRGGEVFARLMQARAEQLALSVAVLTDDFGFKEAVASADGPTIESALINHAARIQADLALVTDNRGALVASSQPLNPGSSEFLAMLHARSGQAATAYTPLIINDKPYQFVVSPVRAPLPIGSAGIGFEIEDNLSEALKRLTGLDVSFVRFRATGPDYLSGTLAPPARTQLLAKLTQDTAPGSILASGDDMLLRVVIAEQPYRLEAVLQVPLSQVLAPFASLDRQLIWLTLVFLLLAAVVAWVLARGVTRPLSILADTARRIAGGDYSTPVPVVARDEMGTLAQGFHTMQHAIGEREQQIRYQAERDALTGLYNRAQLLPQLASRMSAEPPPMVALWVIDIENFTQINDALSPEIGDQVLVEVGRRLQQLSHSGDGVFRLGSDEFALVVAHDDALRVPAVAQALQENFAVPVSVAALSLHIDLNVGVACAPRDGDNPEVLLRRATLALQQARTSQQWLCHYQAGWDERHLQRLHLYQEFRSALQQHQLQVYFQPKLSLQVPEQLAAEALVRWIHPSLGFVNPEEFISVAESTGQITELSRWVLEQALVLLAEFDAQPLKIAVNLSALDLLEDELPDYLLGLLQRYRVTPERLCLEITESAIMREAERSLTNLARLHSLGVSIAIDDFGTGYSSLSQLKKLPVSELKIDKSFILELDHSEDDQLIVRSTIDLAHTLGLSVTAEGVETLAAEQLLRTYGCDQVQGYLYAKALPRVAFCDWVQAYRQEICV